MPFARLSQPERKLAYTLLKYRVITRKRAQQVPSCLHWESFIILSRTSAPRFHGISFRPVFPNLFFLFFFFHRPFISNVFTLAISHFFDCWSLVTRRDNECENEIFFLLTSFIRNLNQRVKNVRTPRMIVLFLAEKKSQD